MMKDTEAAFDLFAIRGDIVVAQGLLMSWRTKVNTGAISPE